MGGLHGLSALLGSLRGGPRLFRLLIPFGNSHRAAGRHGYEGLDRLPGRVEAYPPDWSPDGSRLVFSVHNYGGIAEQTRVDTIGANGAERQTVFAPKNLFASDPVFSPDGTKIALRFESGADIWTIDLDGSDPTNVTGTPFPERREKALAWRPRPTAAG